jgi:hypothetical protein
MRYLLIIILLLWSAPLAEAACTVSGATQNCTVRVQWQWSQGSGGPADGFTVQKGGKDLANTPASQLTYDDSIINDPGNTQLCYDVLAFNSAGKSPPSAQACVTTPVINVVTMKTAAIVTVSHRSTDTSTIIAILVNANTVIGAGGLELTYPPGFTLTVSRRASNTSSVIAILVNKSTNVVVTSP